jgi:hypothetical protein
MDAPLARWLAIPCAALIALAVAIALPDPAPGGSGSNGDAGASAASQVFATWTHGDMVTHLCFYLSGEPRQKAFVRLDSGSPEIGVLRLDDSGRGMAIFEINVPQTYIDSSRAFVYAAHFERPGGSSYAVPDKVEVKSPPHDGPSPPQGFANCPRPSA